MSKNSIIKQDESIRNYRLLLRNLRNGNLRKKKEVDNSEKNDLGQIDSNKQ